MVVIGDAFQPVNYWTGFMPPSSHRNVALDVHHYQVFSPGQLAMSEDQHIQAACAVGHELNTADKPSIVGEWSGAFTDCAKWLNGYGRESRYMGLFGGGWYLGECGRKRQGAVADLPIHERTRIRRLYVPPMAVVGDKD